jgi:NAD(P)-dependent dehydrogenase (short-subunit alcohol dehydrogenase family)
VERVGRGLEGKVGIITGAANGIGRACAHRLADDGAALVLTDIDGDGCRAVAADLAGRGFRVLAAEHDVAEEAAWTTVVAYATSEFGRLDVLVNNAGIGGWGDVEDETKEGYDRVIAVTQTGMWLGMKHAGPSMRATGGGSIVNISSVFGASGGFGTNFSYHAAKGAVRLMTKNAAIRWATEGIRVNSVHPGFIATAGVLEFSRTEEGRTMIDLTPMARLGEPEEVAAVVSFLSSDDASFMTGSEVYVDGGFLAR